MDTFAILLSLGVLTYIAYRGYSVIFFAPFCAMIAVIIAGKAILPQYSEVFMGGAMNFAKAYFPLFLLGAVFGKVVEISGMARSISHWIMRTMGEKATILSVVLSCGILSYGGVSVFVGVFAIYPIGAALFREANIPKRLLPGAIACGLFTFAMTALPGTPQIQNLIPTKYFGTNAFAAPWIGLICGLFMFGAGMAWLEWRHHKAKLRGEGYGEGHINEPDKSVLSDENMINPALALIPLISVLVFNYVFTKWIGTWDPAVLTPYTTVPLKNVAAIWALIMAIVVGIVLAFAIGANRIFKGEFKLAEFNLTTALTAGVGGSLLAIMNTASEVGYGSVISKLPGFEAVKNFMMSINIGDSPLVSTSLMINVLAGITGSASGGLSIALEAMGSQYLAWAVKSGVSPEILHKVASISCGGFDSLPHNGAIITLLAICGLTHRKSYVDIGFCTVLVPFVTGFLAIALFMIFGVF